MPDVPIRHLAAALCALIILPKVTWAQDVTYDAATHRWTVQSGPTVYRLAARGDTLVVDYIGPAARATSWSADSSAPPRYDLAGLADGRSLAPPALRLAGYTTRTIAPGVAELRFTLGHRTLPLEIDAVYTAWDSTGVVTRDLTLMNRGSHTVHVDAAPSLAWDLPAGDYTLRYLYGSWGQERQLGVESLGAGARVFDQTSGRSTNGYVPWLSLRNKTVGVEYLADLAWSGNWTMRIERRPGTGDRTLRTQDVHATLGLRPDAGGAIALAPGDTLVLPRVALTASDGDLDDAANQLHRYERRYVVPRSSSNRPLLVQFNSWYPLGPDVDIASTERTADAAAALGAEVYILDSGWYTSGDWSRTLGDYEPDRTKFPHGLEELARYVHGKGMKFGLWIEIENVGTASRVFREHPDWCLSYEGAPIVTADRCQLDFAKPAVRAWASVTVERLVRTYHLDWIKIDYNIDIGDRFDPADTSRAGRRLYDHVASYYRWLDALRAAHPELVVESCASGGLRFDTGIMAHAHTTWISDDVDPVASLQLAYGCTLQFPAEICNHWMVGDTDHGEVKPGGAPGWWDFMFRVPMTGQFGISSRITEWGPALRERAAANVALYRRIRGTIAGADVYHLT
ncbi:MAG: alpha-galactosidase, partial [Gemmatimonadaceae bacterium]|nr:alpha-galactosidase [Gemmatimonadaceae bacterium]